MTIDNLYMMLDQKDEPDNPFITPKIKQAQDTFFNDVLEVIHRLSNEDDEIINKAEIAYLTLEKEVQHNAFMEGYKTAINIILANGH